MIGCSFWNKARGKKYRNICMNVCPRLYLLLRREGESSFCSARNDVDSGLKEVETFSNGKYIFICVFKKKKSLLLVFLQF